eukprot:TRINITY_DN14808_c0_g1_i1.p1 TRINITY_DN14808_c0_g1~~TRINITY_DN14808_c0_g1_i1.p1  ORF type:complete len:844 (+),score=172.84 TRINITY_DN14808_c0_g1_i1:98-2629(+)
MDPADQRSALIGAAAAAAVLLVAPCTERCIAAWRQRRRRLVTAPRPWGAGRRWKRGAFVARGHLGGTVYEAVDIDGGGQKVAAKLMSIPDAAAAARVRAEIESLASLSHPHIVRYLGSETRGGHAYIFMEFLAQGSLAGMAQRYGDSSRGVGLPICLTQSAVRDVVDALRYLHRRGIVHGNIKGDNVLAGVDGVVKIADFTLCAALRRSQDESVSDRAASPAGVLPPEDAASPTDTINTTFSSGNLSGSLSVTRGASNKVSLQWTAPEVMLRGAYSPASDIWALGCTALELATGRPPWQGCVAGDVEARLREKEAPPLPSSPPLPAALTHFICACLARDPQLRPSSASLARHQFFQEDFTGDSPRASPAPRDPTVPQEPVEHKSDSPLLPGVQEWQRGALLGQGSFGRVFLGIRTDGSLFGVKVVLLGADDEAVRSLRREIETLSRLDRHPNVIEYYGSTYDDSTGEFNVFMEYMSQGTLGALARRTAEPLADRIAAGFMRQVLTGVEFLHSHMIVHRDLKGDNILLCERRDSRLGGTSSLCCKIADFGNAKRFAMAQTQASRNVIGTPQWMAPEVITSDGSSGYEPPADIWSVGCVTTELFSRGRPPWPRFESPWQAVFTIGNFRGELPPGVPSGLSEEAHCFLYRCFRRDPAKRSSATELLQHQWLALDHPREPKTPAFVVDEHFSPMTSLTRGSQRVVVRDSAHLKELLSQSRARGSEAPTSPQDSLISNTVSVPRDNWDVSTCASPPPTDRLPLNDSRRPCTAACASAAESAGPAAEPPMLLSPPPEPHSPDLPLAFSPPLAAASAGEGPFPEVHAPPAAVPREQHGLLSTHGLSPAPA